MTRSLYENNIEVKVPARQNINYWSPAQAHGGTIQPTTIATLSNSVFADGPAPMRSKRVTSN